MSCHAPRHDSCHGMSSCVTTSYVCVSLDLGACGSPRSLPLSSVMSCDYINVVLRMQATSGIASGSTAPSLARTGKCTRSGKGPYCRSGPAPPHGPTHCSAAPPQQDSCLRPQALPPPVWPRLAGPCPLPTWVTPPPEFLLPPWVVLNEEAPCSTRSCCPFQDGHMPPHSPSSLPTCSGRRRPAHSTRHSKASPH